MPVPDACVALLSDFGTRDVYTGVMKAVVARMAPLARLIDLTHEVPPGDVRQAAFRLWQALPYMPAGTVFLAVVDPGVGTARRPLAVAADEFSCVGPDNGIFTYVLEELSNVHAVAISRLGPAIQMPGRPEHWRGFYTSSTFHGRDVFAPAAGLLAAGTKLEQLGDEARDLRRISWPLLSCDPAERWIRGEVLFADRFGNFVTSIGRLIQTDESIRLEPWAPGARPLGLSSQRIRVHAGSDREIPVVRTFGEVPIGQALSYIGSDGMLEIAVNQGSAAAAFGLAPGSQIDLSW